MTRGLIIALSVTMLLAAGTVMVLTQENTPPTVQIKLRGELEGVVDAQGHPVKSTALSNVGVETYVFLEGVATDADEGDQIAQSEWQFGAPEGSQAALTEVGEGLPAHAYFVPDVVGQYTVTFTATDSQGATSEAVLMINAGTFVGIGNIAGSAPKPPQCATCHPDKAESWAATGHAQIFTFEIEHGDHYSESCLPCHTVGYDKTANNNGFDDVAARVGWTFPETMQPGNWDAVPMELKQFANVQCENCHGPGSEHNGRLAGTAISLGAESCGSCHNEPWRHIKNVQWEASGHADETSFAFTYPIGEGHEACVRCHSGEAFIDMAKGEDELSLEFQTVTCAVCHDPHSAEHEAQVRLVEEVTLPDGTQVENAGTSALCMNCHNGRVGPDQVAQEEPHYPHYSTAAEMISGTGGYTYGQPVDDSIHVTKTTVGCVDCHMAPTPGWADQPGGEPLPGHDEVGAHTFKMTSADGVENLAACTDCHLGLATFNRPARGDYDGDGAVEGVQDEVQGLLDLLFQAILDSGVEWLGHYPYWKNVTTEAQKAAIYNWSFVEHDGSLGVHNTPRAVQLLQLSYKDLTGQEVPNADLR